jgi:hypothetical protein
MDFLIASPDFLEQGEMLEYQRIDVDVGKKNDFEIILSRQRTADYFVEKGGFFFVPGTEYGGMFESTKTDTNSNKVKWSGHTWRGLLEQDLIMPQSGQDYRIMSGDANVIIGQVLALNNTISGVFTVPDKLSGITYQNHKFNRYTTVLAGLTRMLLQQDLRLYIHAEQGEEGEPFTVQVEAVPIVDWSDELEYSDDDFVNVHIEAYGGGINHLVCLGQGELKDRTRIDLFIQEDGSIGLTKYFTGLDERIALYSYPNAEDESELMSGGIERLEKLQDSLEMELDISDFDVEIGDIVGGRDRDFGLTLKQPVTGKIFRAENNKTSIEVSVKGGTTDEDSEEE